MSEHIEDLNDLFKQYITDNILSTRLIEYESITDLQKKCDLVYNYMSSILITDFIEMYWTDTTELNEILVKYMKTYIRGSITKMKYKTQIKCLKTVMITYFECYVNENINIYLNRPDMFYGCGIVDVFVEYIDNTLFNNNYLK